MQNDPDKALLMFNNGYNCAQAVLATFATDYNVDENTAIALACGFGAGMGRLQDTCGAVTGAYMVFGLHNNTYTTDKKLCKEKTYTLVQQFNKQFCKEFGTACCRELLQCNLLTNEGQQYYKKHELSAKVCQKCIIFSVALVNQLLQQS